MSDVKDELKNVLESKKRFTDTNVERVFQKIDEKQMEKKVYWKPLFASFTIIAALLTLFFLLPKEQKISTDEVPKQITVTPEEMQEKLIENFDEFTNNSGDEILYSEMGFEGEENLALIISYGRNGIDFSAQATLHEYKNNEWQVIWNQLLLDNKLYITDTPRIIYAGGILGLDVESVLIGEKEIKPIIVKDHWAVFVTMHDVKTDPVFYHESTLGLDRLFTSNGDKFIGNSKLANREGDEFIYEVKEEAMTVYDYERTVEVVVDPSFEVINRYDVVLIDDGINSPYLSRVVALPDDRFKVEKGTIILNDEPQHTPYGSVKVDGIYVYEEYVKNHSLSVKEAEAVREVFTMQVAETRIRQNEYMVVSDNWLRGEMALVKGEHIKGIVKGDSIEQLANEWTTEEKQLYQQMKSTKNKELLKNVSPQTIVRLYYYANFLHDEEIYNYFVSETSSMFVTENTDIGKRLNYYGAQRIQESTFVQEGEIGYLVSNGEKELNLKLIKNSNGYWELSSDND